MTKATDKLPDADRDGDVPRVTLRQGEVCRSLGLGISVVSRLTRAGKLPHFHVGTVPLYPVLELVQWASERLRAAERGEGGAK